MSTESKSKSEPLRDEPVLVVSLKPARPMSARLSLRSSKTAHAEPLTWPCACSAQP